MAKGVLRKNAAIPAGDASVDALAWRFRGVLRVTVIAKATFAFAAEAPATRVEPQAIFAKDVHHGRSAVRSIRFASDRVPYLTRAEIFLAGHAYAPSSGPVEEMRVRLGVFDGTRPVLDKTLLVRENGGFQKIPLVYERAFGGPGCADNPFGVGAVSGLGEPNIVDPQQEQCPAGFTPLGQGLPARKALLGKMPRKVLESPLIELPDDFDWRYFQAAPPGQQVDFLRGNEWIAIYGVHPSRSRVRTRLPGALGLARVHGLSGFGVAEGQPLTLHADVLRIDSDEQRCTLTFRGVFPVPREDALSALCVAAGVQLPGETIAWPDMSALLEEQTMDLGDEDLEETGGAALDGTLVIGAADDAPAAALPFRAGPSPLLQPGPRPGRAREKPLSSGTLYVPSPETDASASPMTLVAAPDAPDAPALPFRSGVSRLAQSGPRPREEPVGTGTLFAVSDDEELLLQTLPFATEIKAPPAPRPPSRTIAVPAIAAPAIAAPAITAPARPAPLPPPVAPRARVEDKREQAATPWAPAPPPKAPAPKPKAPPPPQGPPAPSRELKKGLYSRFGKG